MAAMKVQYTGDSDMDFMGGMILCHKGAVAMAKSATDHGRDPEARQMAEAVVVHQKQEIAQMEAWLSPSRQSARNHIDLQKELVFRSPTAVRKRQWRIAQTNVHFFGLEARRGRSAFGHMRT